MSHTSWQLMLAIGQVLGACVGLGQYQKSDTSSWRVPIALNLLWVVLLVGALFIVPESPRWLLYKGKAAKAEKALHRIHKGSGEDTELLVQEQLAILNKSRQEEADSSSGESKWSDLWSASRSFWTNVHN